MRSIPTLARFIVPLGAAIVLTLGLANGGTSHASGTTIGISPASQVVHMGQPVEFDIAVTGVTNLGVWGVALHWDPAVLAFDSVTGGSFLGSTGRGVSCIPPEVDAVSGTVHIGCRTDGWQGQTPIPGVGGDGVLAHVKFTTVAEGTTNIEFSDVQLADWDSKDCCPGFTYGEGAVTVSAAENAPLPATPTPDAVKLTPTVVSHLPADSLVLGPGAQATAAAGGATPAPVGATGGSSGGPAVGGGSTSSGAAGDVSGIGNAGGSTGGTGVPHAGEGARIRSRSTLVDVLTGLLAAAGLACVAMAVRSWRRRGA